MKKLETKDVFSFARLIKTAGVTKEVKELSMKVEAGEKINIREAGATLIFSVIEGLSTTDSERKFYEFFANPFEMEVKDIESLGILELLKKVEELIKLENPEEYKAFFKSVAHVLNKTS